MRLKSTLILISAVFGLNMASWAAPSEPYTLHYEVKLKSANFGDMGTRKLWMKGSKMRWEYKSANLPIHLIKNDDGVFMLHPWNDVAAKYPKNTPRGNPRALLPGPTGSPSAFLKAVKATKHGQETVNNQLCSVYDYTDSVTKRKCRIWIGVKSGKPVQLLLKGERGKQDTITATYTKYVEGAKAPDSLFQVPKKYTIRPMPERDLTSAKQVKKPTKGKSG